MLRMEQASDFARVMDGESDLKFITLLFNNVEQRLFYTFAHRKIVTASGERLKCEVGSSDPKLRS